MAQEELLEIESDVEDESEFDAAFKEIADERDSGPEEDIVENEPEAEITAEAEPEPEPDPYAGMTDEVKAKFVALEEDRNSLKHRIDSDDGRVRSYQQKVDQLSSEINKIRAGDTAGPSMSQISEAMVGDDDDWAAFSQSYPDVASAIDKRMDKMGKATESAVEQTLAPVKEQAERDKATLQQTENEKRVAAVAAEFPTWTEAVKTPDFSDWLTDQPLGVANLAESDDPRDASTLISLYDSHLIANDKPSLRADPATGVKEEGKEHGEERQLTQLERKRKQQLADGASVASKKSGVNTDGPATSEFEAAFEVFAKKKERQRA